MSGQDSDAVAPAPAGSALALGYHNRSYAKCTFGQTEGRLSPRISHGAATDVRAWWAACRDYQPAEAVAP